MGETLQAAAEGRSARCGGSRMGRRVVGRERENTRSFVSSLAGSDDVLDERVAQDTEGVWQSRVGGSEFGCRPRSLMRW